jgi:hypothetical protein
LFPFFSVRAHRFGGDNPEKITLTMNNSALFIGCGRFQMDGFVADETGWKTFQFGSHRKLQTER